MLTMNVTEFKARCLQLLDKLASHEIEEVTITKRGRGEGSPDRHRDLGRVACLDAG